MTVNLMSHIHPLALPLVLIRLNATVHTITKQLTQLMLSLASLSIDSLVLRSRLYR